MVKTLFRKQSNLSETSRDLPDYQSPILSMAAEYVVLLDNRDGYSCRIFVSGDCRKYAASRADGLTTP